MTLITCLHSPSSPYAWRNRLSQLTSISLCTSPPTGAGSFSPLLRRSDYSVARSRTRPRSPTPIPVCAPASTLTRRFCHLRNPASTTNVSVKPLSARHQSVCRASLVGGCFRRAWCQRRPASHAGGLGNFDNKLGHFLAFQPATRATRSLQKRPPVRKAGTRAMPNARQHPRPHLPKGRRLRRLAEEIGTIISTHRP